jgi:hypothetical protein
VAQPSSRAHAAPFAFTLFALLAGAVYAVLTLIAGIGAFFWLLILLLLTRHLTLRALWPLPLPGFVVGFALSFAALLVPSTLSCQAPSCYTTPLTEDVAWAAIDLAIAFIVFGLSRLGLLLRARLFSSR